MRPLRPALTALLLAAPMAAQAPMQRFTLPNGMTVILLEDRDRPLVRIRLHLALSASDLPADHPGLPSLLLRMMDHSEAGDLAPEAFDQALEAAGIAWSSATVPGGLVWDLAARSRDQDRALGLLAARVLRTTFEDAVLETQRPLAWLEARGGGLPPRERLRRALEPDPVLQAPTLAMLGAISIQDLLALRSRILRPDRAVLVLHGDLGLEQAKQLVLLSLGTWTAPPAAPSSSGADGAPGIPPPVLIPAPGQPLRLQALAVAPLDLAPETGALLTLLLDGDPSPAPVRIEAGGQRLVATLDADGATWASLRAPLESLRQRGFSADDLARARNAWKAGLALATLHPEARMDAAFQEVRGEAPTLPRMEALTLEALNGALRRWLDPARLRLGAAGDPGDLKALATP